MGLSVSMMPVFLAFCSAVLGMNVARMAISSENVRLSFSPYIETFSTFKEVHGKRYKDDLEEAYRYSVFIKNVKQMETHNRKYDLGETTFYMNVNHFSDMSHDEYLRYNRLGKYSQAYDKKDLAKCFSYVHGHSRPESIDWRQKGAVTQVKDQGDCGSCWTFSSTGSIEGQNFLTTGSLLSFSEQQILDCCTGDNCDGCNGGLMDPAFLYLNKTGGLELETDYTYTAVRGSCLFNKSKVKVKVIGCSDIPASDEAALQDAVGNVGPVSVAIDASLNSFQSYSGGIYSDHDCSTTLVDHAVLAVGYGTSNGTDYWLVKNSWGESWGLDGYVKMLRNKNNQCGIATLASFPHTAK